MNHQPLCFYSPNNREQYDKWQEEDRVRNTKRQELTKYLEMLHVSGKLVTPIFNIMLDGIKKREIRLYQ